jgi:HAD superfamily hydrolase (TIGR01509 family)
MSATPHGIADARDSADVAQRGVTPARTKPGVATVLICDCDGVLIDSETVAARVLVAELKRRWSGADVLPAILPLLGLRIEQVLTGVCAHLGRTLDADDQADICRAVEAAAIQAPRVPGVADALRRVRMPMACASNSRTAYVRAALARTGLEGHFGARLYCADQVAQPKPAPDVYLAAARALGVAPAQCLVVEDSAAGVTAASDAGMTVLGFIGTAHSRAEQADVLLASGASCIFESMDNLPPLVNAWCDGFKGRRPWQASR